MANKENLVKFRGKGNALVVKRWIQEELPPLSWNLTMLHLTPVAVKEGVTLSFLDEQTHLSERILLEINFFLVSYFNTALPIFKDKHIIVAPGR